MLQYKYIIICNYKLGDYSYIKFMSIFMNLI